MKPSALIVLLIPILSSCGNQDQKLEFPKENYVSVTVAVNETSVFALIDSLKNVIGNADTSSLPQFLTDKLLDAKYPVKTDHGIFSCRKMIISSVTNKDVLRKIISLPQFNHVLTSQEISKNNLETVPEIKSSIGDLAKERLAELNNRVGR